MELKYSLNEEDILELSLYRIRNLPDLHRRQTLLRWGYLVFMLILTVLLFLMGIQPFVCLFMALVVFGFFIYFPAYQKRQLRRMITRDYKDPTRAAALQNRRAATTPEGIELTTSKGDRKFVWQDIQNVETTSESVFVLFEDKSSFTISRIRVSEGDFDCFVEELSSRNGTGSVEGTLIDPQELITAKPKKRKAAKE
jgi:hypothetical protein